MDFFANACERRFYKLKNPGIVHVTISTPAVRAGRVPYYDKDTILRDDKRYE